MLMFDTSNSNFTYDLRERLKLFLKSISIILKSRGHFYSLHQCHSFFIVIKCLKINESSASLKVHL